MCRKALFGVVCLCLSLVSGVDKGCYGILCFTKTGFLAYNRVVEGLLKDRAKN